MLYTLKIKLDEKPKQDHDVISVTTDGRIECCVKFKTKRLYNNFLIKHKINKDKLDIFKDKDTPNEVFVVVKN